MDLARKEADILVVCGKLVVLQGGVVQQKLPSFLKGPISQNVLKIINSITLLDFGTRYLYNLKPKISHG